jgi:hypothetical protein
MEKTLSSPFESLMRKTSFENDGIESRKADLEQLIFVTIQL